MKHRNGFVSNSSTTSFLIYGISVEKDIEEDIVEKEGLDYKYGPDYKYGSRYIGRSWSSIKDDETGADFKKDVEAKIAKIMGKTVECETIKMAWFNG